MTNPDVTLHSPLAIRYALKEEAVICQALAEGRQALLLRKPDDNEGGFRLEHTRFWLFPVDVSRPRAIHLSHFAEVIGVYHVRDLGAMRLLQDLHLWSEETVETLFTQNRPGLYVMPVRVYRSAEVHELPDTPAYAPSSDWVELERDLSTEGAVPVLDDEKFRDLLRALDRILNPIAFA